MFESGYCWVKVNHISYVAKILEKEDPTHYTIKIGDCIFTNVPIEEMFGIYGDTDLQTINQLR